MSHLILPVAGTTGGPQRGVAPPRHSCCYDSSARLALQPASGTINRQFRRDTTPVINLLCFPVFLVAAPYAMGARFGDALWGLCLAASGLGACLASIATVLTAGHQRLIALAAGCALLLGSAWLVLAGAVEAAWLTVWATAMQTLAPKKDLGKVAAVDTLVTSGALPFVYLGSGLTGALPGHAETLGLAAIASAAAGAAIALLARRSGWQ